MLLNRRAYTWRWGDLLRDLQSRLALSAHPCTAFQRPRKRSSSHLHDSPHVHHPARPLLAAAAVAAGVCALREGHLYRRGQHLHQVWVLQRGAAGAEGGAGRGRVCGGGADWVGPWARRQARWQARLATRLGGPAGAHLLAAAVACACSRRTSSSVDNRCSLTCFPGRRAGPGQRAGVTNGCDGHVEAAAPARPQAACLAHVPHMYRLHARPTRAAAHHNGDAALAPHARVQGRAPALAGAASHVHLAQQGCHVGGAHRAPRHVCRAAAAWLAAVAHAGAPVLAGAGMRGRGRALQVK